jgi:hypothetical protein
MTPELAAARLGRLTASMAAVIMGGLKTDGLAKYVRRLAGERVFGDLGEDSYKSAWMDRGTELENDAITWYEFDQDVIVEQQQHVVHPSIPFAAATPDGLIRGVRTVEGKCPQFHVWCETFDGWHAGKRGIDAVPSEYRWQCRFQPFCCDLREGHFVSFHPVRGGQGLIIPYEVTSSEIDQMTERCFLVNEMVREQEERLRSIRSAA